MDFSDEPQFENRCGECLNYTAVGLDQDIPNDYAVKLIERCIFKRIPFMVISLDNSHVRSWIRRFSLCLKILTRQLHKLSQILEDAKPTSSESLDAGFHWYHVSKASPTETFLQDPCDLLYIATTSGTTNSNQKIVYVKRSSVEPNISDFINMMSIDSTSVIFCSSPLTFDVTVLTILISLKVGAKIHLSSDRTPSKRLLNELKDVKVTHLQLVPSYVKFIGIDEWGRCLLTPDTTVRVINLGGELCLSGHELSTMCGDSPEVIDRISFYNLYGLTEQSIWSMIHKIDSDYIKCKSVTPVPIGRPLTETSYEVLESEYGQELVLCSSSRECLIDDGGGIGLLSSFYLPTGDLVSVTNGQIYPRGRKDVDFVKIHGHRVNLSSLQQKVLELETVDQAYVHYDVTLGLILVYSGAGASTHDVRKLISMSLSPAYQPQYVVYTERMPITAHGKIDGKQLVSYVTNRKHPQDWLHDLLKTHIIDSNLGTIDFEKNFIENGGTSLQILTLAGLVSKMTGVKEQNVLEVLFTQNLSSFCKYISLKDAKVLDSYERATNNELKVKRNRALVSHEGVTRQLQLDDSTVVVEQGGFLTGSSHSSTACNSIPKCISLKWKLNTGKCVDSSPCAVVTSKNTFVYIGSHSHKFYCVNADDGDVVWQTDLGDRIEATPTVMKELSLVLVGCYDGNVYFLDAFSGSMEWNFLTGDIIKSTPAVLKHYAFVGSHDKQLYKLDVKEKSLCWKVELDGGIYSNPVVMSDNLLVTTLGGSLYCIAMADGSISAQTALSAPSFSTPRSADGFSHAMCVDGLLSTHSASDITQVLWSFKASGNVFTSPIVVKYRSDTLILFGCHDNHIYCLDEYTGSCRWKAKCDSTIKSLPFAFKVEDDIFVLVISTSGNVYFMNVDGGSTVNVTRFPGLIFGSPIMVGKKIVVGSRDDNFYCYEYK